MPQSATSVEEDRDDDLVSEDLARRRPVHACGDELLAHLGLAEAAEPLRSGVSEAPGERVERTPTRVLRAADRLRDVAVGADLVERRDALWLAKAHDQHRQPASEEEDACNR